jgi:hypothetical protein
MYFNPTPTNMTALLVVALAIVSVILLIRKKYDSNIPLIFYAAELFFANSFDRPVDPILMYGGLAFVLLLRFEFMGLGFAKFVAFLANISLCAMIWVILAEVGS